MFNRKKSNVEKIRNLKLLISEKYKLPDTAIKYCRTDLS